MLKTITKGTFHIRIAECKQCGFNWVPKVDEPKKCPNCQRYDWHRDWRAERLAELAQQEAQHVCAS
jgi:predicted Zn-ribbon and HTH transcriptional regulator